MVSAFEPHHQWFAQWVLSLLEYSSHLIRGKSVRQEDIGWERVLYPWHEWPFSIIAFLALLTWRHWSWSRVIVRYFPKVLVWFGLPFLAESPQISRNVLSCVLKGVGYCVEAHRVCSWHFLHIVWDVSNFLNALLHLLVDLEAFLCYLQYFRLYVSLGRVSQNSGNTALVWIARHLLTCSLSGHHVRWNFDLLVYGWLLFSLLASLFLFLLTLLLQLNEHLLYVDSEFLLESSNSCL